MQQGKYIKLWSVVLVVMVMTITGCHMGDTKAPAITSDRNMSSFQNDYYDAVNHEVLEGWEIPADKSSMDWFAILEEDSYQKIDAIIQQASSVEKTELDEDLENIRALNLTGLDKEKREKEGYGQQAGTFLEQVEKARNLKELLEICLRFQKDYGYYGLVGLSVGSDPEDSSKKVWNLLSPDIGLSREIWFSQEEANQNQVKEYKKFLVRLHQHSGIDQQSAEDIVEQVTVVMKELASSSLKIEEYYDAEKTNHAYRAEEAAAIYSGVIPFTLLEDIYGIRPEDKLMVSEPELCQKLASYLTEDNLPLLKNYIKTSLYTDLAMISDMDSLNAAQEYENAVSGIKAKEDFERTVSEAVQSFMGFQCGKIYCEKYFNEDSKQDVKSMAAQIIGTYDQKIANLDWMTESTKEEARKKLDTMTVKIGYPDVWPQERYHLKLIPPEDGGLYIDNILVLKKAERDYQWKTLHEPVDRNGWGMLPQSINAYYSPINNEIVFPAGILQPPFYDPNAEPAVNLGGIGTVIGHEITHAFDTAGSQYDEKGNQRDWWSAEDKRRFKELSQKVTTYYEGMELNGMQVNGSLTLIENIADLGSISCCTEIARKNGYDLKAFYESYANLWASKYRDEYLSNLMVSDTHAPAKIRVNAVLSAMDDFYSTYDIKPGDGMYCVPSDRPKVW